MSTFVKRPVVIEAFQWTGGALQTEDPEWIVDAIKSGLAYFEDMHFQDIRFRIKTPEGEMTVSPNDYIIRGVKGEIYPCKPDIFELTYEPVESEND